MAHALWYKQQTLHPLQHSTLGRGRGMDVVAQALTCTDWYLSHQVGNHVSKIQGMNAFSPSPRQGMIWMEEQVCGLPGSGVHPRRQHCAVVTRRAQHLP